MQYNKKTFILSILFIGILSFFAGRLSKEYTVVKTNEIEQNNNFESNRSYEKNESSNTNYYLKIV